MELAQGMEFMSNIVSKLHFINNKNQLNQSIGVRSEAPQMFQPMSSARLETANQLAVIKNHGVCN